MFIISSTFPSEWINSGNKIKIKIFCLCIIFLGPDYPRSTVGTGTLILNVGGTINQVKWETIDKFPRSRLQKLRYATCEGETAGRGGLSERNKKWNSAAEISALCDAYNLSTREFYFDRSPKIFENILGLYRKGELHLTESVCPRDFLGELEYWGLSALHLGE